MISKKVKVTLLASILMVTGVVQTALADTSTQKDTKTKIECGIENFEDDMMTYSTPSFEDLIGEIKKDIKKEDLAKLEKVYKEIQALEKAKKYEESDKKWNEFYNILDKYMSKIEEVEDKDFEDMSFEDFIGEMKIDIKKEDIAKLEKTYKEIETLEKSEKYEEADKKWDEFYNIYDKYIPEMTFEDLVGDIKEDITKEDLVKLEKLFKEAVALEKEEKFEAADKKWDELFNILDEHMPKIEEVEDMDFEKMSFKEISFEDFIGEMKKDIKKEDLAKLEKIYNQAVALEKENKHEESDKEWNKLFEILPKQDFSGDEEELGNK